MPLFNVYVYRTMTQAGVIEVEADTAEDAADGVYDNDDDVTWGLPDVEDIYVDHVELA